VIAHRQRASGGERDRTARAHDGFVAMAIGGSTNVTLHAPEIARAAGYADFWKEIMTPE